MSFTRRLPAHIPWAAVLLFTHSTPADAPAPQDTSAVAELRQEARALQPLVKTSLVRRFLAATDGLPTIETRTVYHDSTRTRYWSAREAVLLPQTTRDSLLTRSLDGHFYYTTRYGSPLAYARPFELLAHSGFKDVAGKKIVDFGYGTVGHLRLLASLGAEVVGIEVDPMLRALYSDSMDQGMVRGYQGRDGSLRLVHGRFPAEPQVVNQVGEGVDLFISKNTLKNGYIHPEHEVNPRMLVHLGVDDSTFVQNLYRILKPGGYVMIYNLCPAPAPPDKPYIPWADGRCPFKLALWQAVGFRVLELDRDDGEAARRMAHALGWDQGEHPMDLRNDLFATYSLLRKPR